VKPLKEHCSLSVPEFLYPQAATQFKVKSVW
jgi:hypothetical protein